MRVLVLYYTKTGHTLEAAEATAKGIRTAGSEADLVSVDAFDAARLSDYDAFVVGCPCWAGITGHAILPPPMDRTLNALPAGILAGKRCGGVSVHSGTGAENTVRYIGEILVQKGCEDFRPGPVARAGVPFSLWVGPPVGPEDEAQFRAYGTAFVS